MPRFAAADPVDSHGDNVSARQLERSCRMQRLANVVQEKGERDQTAVGQ